MIEIDIKMIPFGNRNNIEILNRITIINDATGSKEFGNYNALVRKGIDGDYIGGCYIKNFPRQELTAVELLLYVLRKINSKRNNVKRNTAALQTAIEAGVLEGTQSQVTSQVV